MVSTGEIVARRFDRRGGLGAPSGDTAGSEDVPRGGLWGEPGLFIEGRPNACEAVGPLRGFWYMLNRPAGTPGVI